MTSNSSAKQTSKELFAGSIGGIVQVSTGQPFDTIKVRLQTSSEYSGAIDCIRKTIKNEGPLALYKGTLTPLIGVGACVSIQFGALEYAKRQFSSFNISNGQPKELTNTQLFLSGAFSGLANSFLSGPIEHIRTRLQVQSGATKSYTGPLDLVRKVSRQYGVGAIFKGQNITIIREFFGFGIYFTTYEYLMQREMKKGLERKDIAPHKQMLFGAAAGATFWCALYPVDVVKSKLQTDSFDKSSRKYKGIVDCFRKTLRNEGMIGLYRGFWPCMVRSAPVNAATFVAYEATMNLIGR